MTEPTRSRGGVGEATDDADAHLMALLESSGWPEASALIASRTAELNAALARAEKAEGEERRNDERWVALYDIAVAAEQRATLDRRQALARNAELIALLAEFQGAAEVKDHYPVWRVGRRHVLRQRDAALARVRELEEGLREIEDLAGRGLFGGIKSRARALAPKQEGG